MTSSAPAPGLLPGTSASTWQRVFSIFSWLYVPAVLLVFAAQFFHWKSENIFLWFIPMFSTLGFTFVLIFVFSRRNKKELDAGYTTLWRSNPTVPQLDAVTGAVIRQAGQPYVSRADWRSHAGSTVSIDGYAPALGKPTLWQRALPALPGFLFLIVVIVVVSVFGRIAQGLAQVFGLVFAGFMIVLVIVILSILATQADAQLKRLREAAPGKFVFFFSSSPKFIDAAAGMVGDETIVPVKPYGASADNSGITFWGGKPPRQCGTLPWSRVTSIQADRVATGNTWRPAILISYTVDGGSLQAVELLGANADRAQFRSLPEVRWMASELNAMRSGSSNARVI